MTYTLDRLAHYFRKLGSAQALSILYLISRFDGCYLGDLAAVLQINSNNVVRICNELESLNIITKSYVTRKGGRMVLIKIHPDTANMIRRFLSDLDTDPEILYRVSAYQKLKDEKMLLGDKYSA